MNGSFDTSRLHSLQQLAIVGATQACTTTMTDANSSQEGEASLPKLLAALGSGARAVQSLPLDDEFAFQSSFPEFSQSAADSRERLMDVLALVDPSLRGRDASDPTVWEACAEICDALMEQAEIPTQQTTALQDISSQGARTSTGIVWTHDAGVGGNGETTRYLQYSTKQSSTRTLCSKGASKQTLFRDGSSGLDIGRRSRSRNSVW